MSDIAFYGIRSSNAGWNTRTWDKCKTTASPLSDVSFILVYFQISYRFCSSVVQRRKQNDPYPQQTDKQTSVVENVYLTGRDVVFFPLFFLTIHRVGEVGVEIKCTWLWCVRSCGTWVIALSALRRLIRTDLYTLKDRPDPVQISSFNRKQHLQTKRLFKDRRTGKHTNR